ncbi:hypothetical protein AV955_gp101 [Diadromus pulchellus ascovirus 4a]|uniref:Complete DpAV4 genome n=1 Tax=Diadromus pulchellus ascovirus 4a TaxID=158683 RepID=F2NZ30_9VIRU|nr:hypothetical protein AV955_gp101 [Diadromus pulchellus ascovirus 4a]CCA61458.1 unnamed protein product [Diadromus pulchellus ascovirus 4a]
MLEDDLIDLYNLLIEEQQIKSNMAHIKNELLDVKDSVEEVKERLLGDMKTIGHNIIKYKNMSVALTSKPEKIKPNKDELADNIDVIIRSDREDVVKREMIMSLLKPQPSGQYSYCLKIKLNKK